MKSLWNDNEAKLFTGELGQRVYTSRLLGREPSLVLHGGGNTSVKIRERNIVGEEETILYVKGSGWDLENIEAAGFSPVRMDYLLKLATLPALSDPQMVNELRTHMTSATAPTPSVETILHAILPYKYVDHTHADAIIAITNTSAGQQRIEEIYGDELVMIPYIMPGFDLARSCAELFVQHATTRTRGMILLNHGIFSFGDTARVSYERMIELVTRAEDYLTACKAWFLPPAPPFTVKTELRVELAMLRHEISRAAGFPVIMSLSADERALEFARRNDVDTLARQGPATPDHIIRTKRIPMIGRDVSGFVTEYERYFQRHAPFAREKKTMLDPAPRVVLDPEFGLCTVGKTAQDAAIVMDIYQHTLDVILRATALGGYQALPERDLFDMEYWDLEQAKLRKSGQSPEFTGEIVLITGAASGIGKACVNTFLARGAAIIALDINPVIATLHHRPDYLGIQCDITDEAAVMQAIEQGVRVFGGLDMLILNAGIFPAGCPLAELDSATWRQVMQINLDANLALLRLTYPLLKFAPKNGRVIAIGSRNALAPGPGAAAYSVSKAALTQLMRVAIMEWSKDNIRINCIHPDAVYDTALWTDEVLAARATHYAMSVADYKKRNLLKTEVSSADVAALAATMAGPVFAKTTGAQIPQDGGNERVI